MPLRARHACLLLLVLAPAGCRTQDARVEVREAATAFARAVQDGDTAAACERLSPQTRKALVENEDGAECSRAIEKIEIRGGAPASVEVFGDGAVVELGGGDTLFLTRGKEGWRVDAAGCSGHGDEPLDCEVEA